MRQIHERTREQTTTKKTFHRFIEPLSLQPLQLLSMVPSGWEKKKDPDSGKWFYVNRELRMTSWTIPLKKKKKKKDGDGFEKGKIDPDDFVAILSKCFEEVSSYQIVRPKRKVQKEKEKWLDHIRSLYCGLEDFILHELFRYEAKKCEDLLCVLDKKKLEKKCKLYPNMFPYDLPPGILHYIMWYTCTRPSDADITKDIAKSLGRDDDFIWYENPKMSIPELFHVQVFVFRSI